MHRFPEEGKKKKRRDRGRARETAVVKEGKREREGEVYTYKETEGTSEGRLPQRAFLVGHRANAYAFTRLIAFQDSRG